jgi:hypothetical protein
MLNPSRQVVIVLAITSVVLLALGLATDFGLFGWTLAIVIGLYLVVAGIMRRSRPSGSAA